MGISGRSLEKDHTIQEFEEAFIEYYGRVKEVAQSFGCQPRAIYDLLDVYPELQDARKKGSKRYMDRKVETADEVLDKLIKKVEEDPTNAGRQAQFVLKNAKISEYYEAPRMENSNTSKADELIDKLDQAADAATK